MTMLTQTTYDSKHFEDNGPKIIDQFGTWGAFIGGEMVDGPYYTRQDAMDAYAQAVRELAEREQAIPFDGEPVDGGHEYGLQAVA